MLLFPEMIFLSKGSAPPITLFVDDELNDIPVTFGNAAFPAAFKPIKLPFTKDPLDVLCEISIPMELPEIIFLEPAACPPILLLLSCK